MKEVGKNVFLQLRSLKCDNSYSQNIMYTVKPLLVKHELLKWKILWKCFGL